MNTNAEAAGAERDEPGSDAAADPESPEPEPAPARHHPGPGAFRGADVSVATMPGVHHRFDRGWLAARLAAALGEIDRPVERISVIVVDDRRMTELHDRYMGLAETTDVLTFPASSSGGAAIDVDIAVCADEAARQAGRRGHGVDRELLLYALHGVLHCAGFDDDTNEAYRAMHAEEDRILRAIGEAPVFASSAEGGDG
jgi:probable rRNA maturation factor